MTKKEPGAKKILLFGTPGAFAVARNQAGFDWAAGAFLYRIKFRWGMSKKLERLGLDWVAMSREDWAKESGLSFGEFKNRALPRLRKFPYVKIRSMKLKPGTPKLLWVHFDPAGLPEYTTPFDMDPIQTGISAFGEQKWTAYPYKSDEEQKFTKSKTA